MNSKVNWYGESVKMLLQQAEDELLDKLAFATEGQAKENIQANDQIETGFMLNSGYTVSARRDGYSGAVAGATSRADREMMSKARVKSSEAAVHFAANYAIYQELRKSFLYRAVEQVADKFGAIVKTVRVK